MNHAEVAYRTFLAHADRCIPCRNAGGELAEDANLCPTGRTLMRNWERAEVALYPDAIA